MVRVSAMGGFQGSLASVTAPELGAVTIKEAIARAGLQANRCRRSHYGLCIFLQV